MSAEAALAPQALHNFRKQLEDKAGVKLKLKINNNRSTMLSVRWEPDHTKVSMHRMFLGAPRNVMEALACYIRGEHKIVAPMVRSFIEDNLRKLNYSHLVNPDSLQTAGEVVDLRKVYDKINKQYFDGELNLLITWFGKHGQKNKTRATLGLYNESLKLIKIHRSLDDATVPLYVVEYVVYHEMVHHVCPSYVDAKGNHRIHSEEFKQREDEFRYIKAAKEWISANQDWLFGDVD